MGLSKQVAGKLDEYGIEIFKHHAVDDEYVYYAENMIVFVNEEENSIAITFQATTKPERSATLALILNQLKKVPIIVMEPFIFNEKNEFISGEKAYRLIAKADHTKLINEYNKQQNYSNMLEHEKCHEC